jgi:ABC-type Fe3+/spermidine/putrescine transport system ATPase subunit
MKGVPVELDAVERRFGAVAAVAGVDLAIAAGEFCTLLGPSGSGKTTLLKLIAGFETPSAGSIRIGGRTMEHVPVAKRNIGMVFQNYALFPHMTVARNVAFPLEMRKVERGVIAAKVEAALALVDLAGYGGRTPRELSGGQQQRVALARALVFDPDILLMDEPLGALDKNLRQSIQIELKALHRRLGVTIVYVTHDQEEALFLSDRIVVLESGRIAQIGAPDALYHRPVSRFVATFLGDCNLLPATVAALDPDVVTLAVAGGMVRVARPAGDAPRLGDALTLACRPERLTPAPAGASHAIYVEVDDVIFLGPSSKLLLRADGHVLTALVDRPRLNATTPIVRGDRIAVRPDAEAAFLLPPQ